MQKTNVPKWLTSSVLILILANLIPVYAVFFLGWKAFLVILIFWIENVIVGIFNVARMFLVAPESRITWLAKLFLIPFFWNYIGKGEFRRVSLNNLMEQPYGRVVVLHITILASGFLVMALNSPLIGLLVLIALKIGMDVRAHLAEHRKLEPSH